MAAVWNAVDEFARRNNIHSFQLKGDVEEAQNIRKWIQLITGAKSLGYQINATGQSTSIVPPHDRKPEELQPCITELQYHFPTHRHNNDQRDHQAPSDFSHCAAVECLYDATYYTPTGTNEATYAFYLREFDWDWVESEKP